MVYHFKSYTFRVTEDLLFFSHPQRAGKSIAFGAKWIRKRKHGRRKENERREKNPLWMDASEAYAVATPLVHNKLIAQGADKTFAKR